jgi:hypothetical protein
MLVMVEQLSEPRPELASRRNRFSVQDLLECISNLHYCPFIFPQDRIDIPRD